MTLRGVTLLSRGCCLQVGCEATAIADAVFTVPYRQSPPYFCVCTFTDLFILFICGQRTFAPRNPISLRTETWKLKLCQASQSSVLIRKMLLRFFFNQYGFTRIIVPFFCDGFGRKTVTFILRFWMKNRDIFFHSVSYVQIL